MTYKIYRSATTPVSIVPGNLIASGVTGTTYADSGSLTSGTTYYYVTRAVDGSGFEDANTTEKSGAPTGTISSSTLFSETFDGTTFPPTGWTTTVVGTSTTAAAWARVTTSTNPTGITPHNASTAMAEFNSYHAQAGGSNRLARTANMNIPAGTSSASAVLWVYHETAYPTNGDQIQIQTSPDGTTWTNRGTAINRYDGSTGWKQHTVDLAALIGAGNFRIGYLGVSAYGNDTYMDDVSVSTMTGATCTTGSSSPNPKEASPIGNPLTAAKAAGTTVNVSYTPGCGATDHAIYRGTGPISGVVNWTNAHCSLGATSPATFDPGTPSSGSFYYFVIVAQNAGKEGSYGTNSSGAERPEANNAGWSCNKPQDLSGSCP